MPLTGKILMANNTSSSHIFSGDKVNLVIEIENKGKLFVKEIYLTLVGVVNVKWEDLMNRNKNGMIIYFMQKFEDLQIVLNKHVTIQAMDELDEGKYNYDVQLNIPHQLPESINRKYGSVKYTLQLVVNSIDGIKVLYEMPLSIKACLNVSHYKEYMQPFHTIYRKSMCCGICNTQPLKIILTLPNISFIPSDSINYFVKIEHFGKFLDLQRLSIILTQMQHYKSFYPTERTKQVHTTLSQTMHLFNETHHNSNIHGALKLPLSLVPTSMSPCLLTTSYKIRFILVFVAFYTDGNITVPIIIGSHRATKEETGNFIKYETVLQIGHKGKSEYEV